MSLLVMVPAPKLNLPGCIFAPATRSSTLLSSLAALTKMNIIVLATSVIGTKSVKGS